MYRYTYKCIKDILFVSIVERFCLQCFKKVFCCCFGFILESDLLPLKHIRTNVGF